MDLDAGRQRFTGGGEEGRPVHGVEAEDPLADDVHPLVRLQPPPPVVGAARLTEAQRTEVVGERVEPDVDHL